MRSPVIRSDIPLPTDRKPHGTFAFLKVVKQLEVGQSVFFPGTAMSQVSPYLTMFKKDTGHNYTARRDTERKTDGVRVWRIA